MKVDFFFSILNRKKEKENSAILSVDDVTKYGYFICRYLYLSGCRLCERVAIIYTLDTSEKLYTIQIISCDANDRNFWVGVLCFGLFSSTFISDFLFYLLLLLLSIVNICLKCILFLNYD